MFVWTVRVVTPARKKAQEALPPGLFYLGGSAAQISSAMRQHRKQQ